MKHEYEEVLLKDYLPKGTKLENRYIIQEVIARGGFGITYRAFDLLLNSTVALKEFFVEGFMERDSEDSLQVIIPLDKEKATQVSECRENFRREIQIMKLLENIPGISRLRDSFDENNTSYIVMKYLRGRTFLELHKMGERQISPPELFSSMSHMLYALGEMHRLGLLHRDICPGNLFLTEDGDVILIDFGSATHMNTESEVRNSMVFGHEGFHAPEYRNPLKQGPWTDIYSLCASIVFIICGEILPPADQRLQEDPLPRILLNRSLSTRQQNILLQGLEMDPALRLKSVTELILGLKGELYKQFLPREVEYSAGTDIGSRRINQDNFLVDGLFYYAGYDFWKNGRFSCMDTDLHMIAVCDGVGGLNSGELSSRAVAQALNHFLEQQKNSEVHPERLLDELLDQINEKILILGKKIGPTATTMTFLLWKGNQYYVVNVGDSPAFRLRKRKLEMLTVPHILVSKRIAEGAEISHRDYHILSNYMGKAQIAGSQMAAIRHGHLKKGDVFLLCTDGISNKVDQKKLKGILKKTPDKAMEVIRKILKRSSNNDNYTAVIVRFI